jgi:hypothetical protein
VVLRETVPLALAAGRPSGVVNAAGRSAVRPLASSPDLPVLIGVRWWLERWRGCGTTAASSPRSTRRGGQANVVFEVGGRWLWFGPQLTAEDIRAVTAVEQTLARRAEIPGARRAVAGQVIVRWSRHERSAAAAGGGARSGITKIVAVIASHR